MKISAFGATDRGRKRKNNEDNFLIDKDMMLFIVADGMGGHDKGEIASRTAIQIVHEEISKKYNFLRELAKERKNENFDKILSFLAYAVNQSSSEIYSLGIDLNSNRGIGTTLSLLLIIEDKGFIAHVGDTRIYLFRQENFYQMTEDHTLLNEMKKNKIEVSEDFGYKNVISRAVGLYSHVDVDTLYFDFLPYDKVLMCSDGLHRYLDNELIKVIKSSNNSKELINQLIEWANNKGGEDNITSIIIEIEYEDPEEQEKTVIQFDHRMETLKKIPLCSQLEYKELVKFYNITLVRDYSSNTFILKEGLEGDELFIIMSGEVEILHKEIPIAKLTAGDYFGEISLIDNEPRAISAKTLTDSRFIVVKRQDFINLLHNDPILGSKLLWGFLKSIVRKLKNKEYLIDMANN